jgi:hypothetical protein
MRTSTDATTRPNRSSMPAPSATEPPDRAGVVPERKNVLLRVDPAVYDALARWAADELRSTTAQIEVLLRRSLQAAGRLPPNAGDMPRRGRPPRAARDRPAIDTVGS